MAENCANFPKRNFPGPALLFAEYTVIDYLPAVSTTGARVLEYIQY